ncbi:MAG: primase-helicase zinc-binding domain-containing protein [Methylicorpusculum sp.]|uniref:DUF7146 domain-containing protein n=1 Tax=Methylicorpusculum sp. TaxID=2713644 RepID=UPI0027198F41|nr:primase-helicase zinc-binding domain-containing protein [Methylicorpusculum sp.]MDO8941067.1 primase-helicase zinc-binding domain-containing protein [Methylicorpusculum sp.]MDP2202334.1 primase-helicase zinc-binding domain-containing protein [Methylicorpusculum sp.]
MTPVSIHSTQVKTAVNGAWLRVLSDLAPELSPATAKPGKHVPCPVHGGKDGFRLFRDANESGGGICNTCGSKPDGFSLLMWLRDWTFPEVLAAVAELVGVKVIDRPIPSARHQRQTQPKRARPNDQQIMTACHVMWRDALSIDHPKALPVRLYLQGRGLDPSMTAWPSLRFHPSLSYIDVDHKWLGNFPALLALVEKGNESITLHRTYLTADGRKAPVAFPKKMMPIPADKQVAGSAIRLGEPGRLLGVTEGIETALAVIEATGMTTWPVLNATMMPSFEIPIGVEKLIIWSDLDPPSPRTGIRPGSHSAQALAAHAVNQGLEVIIREPVYPLADHEKSLDWLDVLNRHGPNAFCRCPQS